MTARGWNGVKAVALTEQGSAEPNLVRIEDYTTGSAAVDEPDGRAGVPALRSGAQSGTDRWPRAT
jgi:hypothetical protein